VDDEQAPFPVQVVVVHKPSLQLIEEEYEPAAIAAGRPATVVVEVVHAPAFVQIVKVQTPCGLQLKED